MVNLLVKKNDVTDTHNSWFFFTILFIVFDYARLQDLLHIGFLRPILLINLILICFLITNGAIFNIHIRQVKLMCLFVLLLACYIPFARNNYYAFATTRSQFLYMPFILSTIVCVNSIVRLKKLISVYICLMIYVSCYALMHGGVGPGNYFHDENDVSLYINMWIPVCYFLFQFENEIKKKIYYAFGTIIGLMAIIMSFSRGGFVGLLCMAFVAWMFSPQKVISLVLICLMSCMLYICAGESYWKEMSTITDTQEGTSRERTETWKTAWIMFLDNPLGVGGNNFQFRFHEYQSEYFKRGMWGRAAHSLWFTLLPELGIFGIFIYLSLLYCNIKDILLLKSIRVNDDLNLRYLHFLSMAFLVSLTGYYASGTFLSVLYYPHYWYLTSIVVAASRIAQKL